MVRPSQDSLRARSVLKVQDREYAFFDVGRAAAALGASLHHLPITLRVLLENMLRHEDGESVTCDDISALIRWSPASEQREIAFHPVRVVMPDSSGIPLLADLSAMRDEAAERGEDPRKINPRCPVDMIIDHAVVAEHAGSPNALALNLAREFQANAERYAFARWAQASFSNLRILPPGNGIIHQVNLEHLARPVWHLADDQDAWAFPDSVVGLDSHTPMVNALGVLGWGVGGIEAASVMLGEPVSMLVPIVVGCRVEGRLRPGITCTDVVLTLTEVLRAKGVTGQVVEFFGPGLDQLSLPDRATLANMAPEYGATMGFFPIDDEAIRFLRLTGRSTEDVALAGAYSRHQGLWRPSESVTYSDVVVFDLGTVGRSVAGPRRPQDRRSLADVPSSFAAAVSASAKRAPTSKESARTLRDGDIAIAAITSCTNTSNPAAMIGAGLLARNAVRRGLVRKPWVKTSLSPGSRIVADYLQRSGLQAHLDALGFHLTGFGCMTCAGGSGALEPAATRAAQDEGVHLCAVLSGNRNFEGRIHPLVSSAYLASPALVVAYAIAGNVQVDLGRDPIGYDADGNAVHLDEVWPTDAEIREVAAQHIKSEMFASRYDDPHQEPAWRTIPKRSSDVFPWDPASTRLKRPTYLGEEWAKSRASAALRRARVLAMFGDSVTTDHICPLGPIPRSSPAAEYLLAAGVSTSNLDTYLSRRANHEVMVRGAFTNRHLRNELCPDSPGGLTRYLPRGELLSIYDASVRYATEATPLIVIAGKDYGAGSSRDWAAKGPALLGVRAILAESFERIHRSNLVGMGILPLEFPENVNRITLGLDGTELFDFVGIDVAMKPRSTVRCRIERAGGKVSEIDLRCRLDTQREVAWFAAGGILNHALDHS